MRRFGPRRRHDHRMGNVPGKRASVVDDRAVDEDLLRRLGRFEVEHGRVPVARRYRCGDGFPLGLRLRTCLAQALERHQMLRRALGGDLWPIRTPVTFRNEALAHLWVYVRERHSAWVPTSYVCDDGFKLGMWVHRRRRRRGADPELDVLLQSLPGWTWEPRQEEFQRRVRLAQEAALGGRPSYDLRLRDWVGEQRRAARAGRLDAARVELFEEAGLIDVHLHRG
jgi:hypothetical protein